MIPATALRLAGPGACLVRRPRGVLHAYAGKLTRSGAAVPAARRPLCGTRSKRLRCCSTFDTALDSTARVCLRCAWRLEKRRPVTVPPFTRDGYLQAYAGTTMLQLAHDAEAARTADELDRVAHLSLLLFGARDCQHVTLQRPYGETTLHQVIGRRRDLDFESEERAKWRETHDALAVAAYAELKSRRAEEYRDREARIARLGMNNAVPNPRRRKRS